MAYAIFTLTVFMMVSGIKSSDTETVKLEDLSWLAGTWIGSSGGFTMEEHWSTPLGGLMLGLHRDVKGERTVSWEFLRIEAGSEGLAYLASPRGRSPATRFSLVESSQQRAVFENRDHDFPNRILYWTSGDTLFARVEGIGEGKPAPMEWRWLRQGAGREGPKRR